MCSKSAPLRCPDRLTFKLGALALRFAAFRMAVARARRAHLRPTPADLRRAERELAQAHGAGNWTDLMDRYAAWSDIGACLIRHRTARALSFAGIPRSWPLAVSGCHGAPGSRGGRVIAQQTVGSGGFRWTLQLPIP